jgi:hypothetical protein
MAISYVAAGSYTFTGTADTVARAGIPSGIQVGDLLVCCFGNVSSVASAATMNNSWTKIQEKGTGGAGADNCYFLMAAKIATSTETAAAGSNVQIATLPSTDGQSTKTAQTTAYRGTETTVGAAIIASNSVHESSPGDQTINTGAATATVNTQWYAFFYNMAAGNTNGDQSAGTFSSSAGTVRGHARVYNSGATNSGCAGGDSNGTISTGSKSTDGTWSGTATRLNAGIVIISPLATTSASGGTTTPAIVTNSPVSRVGAQAGRVK